MSIIVRKENYLDNDVAYLLGMILMRGTFYQDRDIRKLIIEFPYKSLQIRTLPDSKLKIDKDIAIKLSLEEVRNKIQDLLGTDTQIIPQRNKFVLVASFLKNTLAWRNLTSIFENKRNYMEFSVPDIIFSAPIDIQKDFVRGIADSASSPSPSDADQAKIQRIVIEFNHKNWHLPVQVCKLVQEHLKIKVNHILWGHPNIRTPNRPKSENWKKEHRMRIIAQDFIPIGYNFEYKQVIFEDLVEWNQRIRPSQQTKFCNPKIKKPRTKHPKHKDEKSADLPKCLRKHFDANYQICLALGCEQGEPSPQMEIFEEEI